MSSVPLPGAERLSVWFERRRIEGNPWIEQCWVLAGLAAGGGAPAASADRRVVAVPAPTLHGDEAEGYLMNVVADEPSLFFKLRPADGAPPDAPPLVADLSANFYEAARWMDAGETVERLPLPPGWRERIEAHARAHWREPERRRGKGRFARSGDHHERPGH